MTEARGPTPPAIPRDCGVEDIDEKELARTCRTIRHVVQRELDVTVQRLFVMGSFARGEARRVASDLDVRVVVSGWVPEEGREPVEHLLKNEYGAEVVPEACGFLDARLSNLVPDEDPNHEVTELM